MILKKNRSNYSIEHVVPQSNFKFDKQLKCDMHNLFYYPYKINWHRSNYKYTSDVKFYKDSLLLDDNGNEIKYSSSIKSKTDDICIKTPTKKIFLPPVKYRGKIARSSMYFLATYPEYENIIFRKVINPYTILNWHHLYPVTEFEKYKNEKILEHQENNNIFVTDPQSLVSYMEDILKTNLNYYRKDS